MRKRRKGRWEEKERKMEREGKEDGKRSKGRWKEKERKMGREVKED